MRLPAVHWEHSGLTAAALRSAEEKLSGELARMRDATGTLYDDDRGSINLPLDKHHLRACQALARKHAKASLLVVVGIGGSNLGTIAVQEAILGKLHNLRPGKRVLYADTVDPDQMAVIAALLDDELRKGRHVVIDAISKSGTTTETIANLEILLGVLRQRKRDPKRHVIVTTDADSRLWTLAKDEGFETLAIPRLVGGRYSVLSPVGLFPLALLGVNITALLDGAAHMRAACLRTGHAENPAIARAALLALARSEGRNIADHFVFKTDFEAIGKWYRQLMGESIGKEWDAQRKNRVWMGITPTVSVGSTDLHSMAQLYFGGPNDKLFTIVTIERWARDTGVPRMERYGALAPDIQGKRLGRIMDAIAHGVTSVMNAQKRPYCRIELPDASEFSIGALLQLHMMEMMFLAPLLDVNPFDQSNVEAYKEETRKALAK